MLGRPICNPLQRAINCTQVKFTSNLFIPFYGYAYGLEATKSWHRHTFVVYIVLTGKADPLRRAKEVRPHRPFVIQSDHVGPLIPYDDCLFCYQFGHLTLLINLMGNK